MVPTRVSVGTIVRGQLDGRWFVGTVARRVESTRMVWVAPDLATMTDRGETKPIQRFFGCEELRVVRS